MNKEHYDILIQGATVWNEWRQENPDVTPDLRDASLAGAYLPSANLAGAKLRGATLWCALLDDADLAGADLVYTNLAGAILAGANLYGANLYGADLYGADLYGADLTGANLRACTGNGRHIKSLQTDHWPIAYTATHMQVGCQGHSLVEWWSFSDEAIERMANGALAWWRKWKPVLRKIIEISPAEPTKKEDK